MELNSSQQEAIQAILADVLGTVRPEELILVDSVFDRPVRLSRGNDSLGFGESIPILLIIYPLLEVLKTLIASASEGFSKKLGELAAESLAHHRAPHTPDVLQLNSLRIAAVNHMQEAGIPVGLATQCGDALLATLTSNPHLLARLSSPEKHT